MKRKEAFTLIELVIATSILTITVFGIYKLIAENIKIVNNSAQNINASLLLPVIETCLENLDLPKDSSIIIGQKIDIYLGNDLKKCEKSSNPTIIDKISYSLSAKKISENEWETQVESEYSGMITGNYINKK